MDGHDLLSEELLKLRVMVDIGEGGVMENHTH